MVDPLPRDSAPTGAWRTLDPRSVEAGRWAGLIFAGIAALVGVAVCAIFIAANDGETLVIALAVGCWILQLAIIGRLAWLLPLKRFRYTRFRLDADGLVIGKGRLWRREIAVLRARIQHTELKQGPLQRAFDLATLTFHTAASDSAEIELAGLPLADARWLRRELGGPLLDDLPDGDV